MSPARRRNFRKQEVHEVGLLKKGDVWHERRRHVLGGGNRKSAGEIDKAECRHATSATETNSCESGLKQRWTNTERGILGPWRSRATRKKFEISVG